MVSGAQLDCGLGSGRKQPFRVRATEAQPPSYLRPVCEIIPKLAKTNAREAEVKMG